MGKNLTTSWKEAAPKMRALSLPVYEAQTIQGLYKTKHAWTQSKQNFVIVGLRDNYMIYNLS